jgi:crotonobetainyl-CoA:carnitine CoA-transferase CaiB-like acyl-CoA transferase
VPVIDPAAAALRAEEPAMPDEPVASTRPQDRSTGPSLLSGLSVVRFGGSLAAGLASRLLAEQGARLVAVHGPMRPAPTPADPYLDGATPPPLTLDLKSPAGRGRAGELVRAADVLIEGFRPGVMERLALGPEEACALNPRLIYLRLPGFASADAERRDLPGWEGALGAAFGLYTDVDILRQYLGLPPAYTALAHASVYGAVHGALAVALALHARAPSGLGDVIEVPLAAAGAAAFTSAAMRIVPQPARYDLPELPRPISRWLMPAARRVLAGLPPRCQQGLARLAEAAVPALMSSYQCADGRLLYVFAVDHDRLPRALLDGLGLWTDLEAAGLRNRDPYQPAAARDNVADSTRLSWRWQRRLRRRLAATLRARPAADWEAFLTARGIPCAVQRTTREWLRHPALAAAGIVESDGPGTRHPGIAAWVETPPSRAQRDGGLAGAGAPPPTGPRLAGHLVLDLSSMVAGPVCGRTLAEYGARVIKIDSPRPHHGPRLTCWYGVDVNQGKESILLDLARPAGRRVLDRLISRADVLLHNVSPGAAERLGLDPDRLHAANPRLVVAQIGAFRGPHPGPFDGRRGYDPVLQACAGIMLRYGGETGPRHHGIASCVDYLTGYLSAWSVALGLLARAQAGRGGTAVASLAQAALLIQLPFAVERQGAAPERAPGGPWSWGSDALNRLYRARDGWVFVAAPAAARRDLCDRLGLRGEIGEDRALARALSAAIRRRGRATLQRLSAGLRGVAVLPVDPLAAIVRAILEPAAPPGSAIADGATLRSIERAGPDGATIRSLLPTYARARSAPLRQLAPAPRLGADTARLLREIGLATGEIDALVGSGAASLGLHPRALPD